MLDKFEKSKFISASHSEKEMGKSNDNDSDDDYSALTFKDFCM